MGWSTLNFTEFISKACSEGLLWARWSPRFWNYKDEKMNKSLSSWRFEPDDDQYSFQGQKSEF